MSISNTTPVYAVPDTNLVPVSSYLKDMLPIPPSRMFLINKSLKVYQEKNPGAAVFDASQGDGGASLPGVPRAILERAAQMQIEHGTSYDMPFGTDAYRKSVVEKYWKLDPALGFEELDGSSTRQKLSTVASSRRRIGAFRIDRVPRARGQSGR